MFTFTTALVVLSALTMVAAAFDAGVQNYTAPATSFESMCGNSAWDGFKAGLGL